MHHTKKFEVDETEQVLATCFYPGKFELDVFSFFALLIYENRYYFSFLLRFRRAIATGVIKSFCPYKANGKHVRRFLKHDRALVET